MQLRQWCNCSAFLKQLISGQAEAAPTPASAQGVQHWRQNQCRPATDSAPTVSVDPQAAAARPGMRLYNSPKEA